LRPTLTQVDIAAGAARAACVLALSFFRPVGLAYRRVPFDQFERQLKTRELTVAQQSAGLPSQRQVIDLLAGEFARAGYDIEDVVVDAAARPPRVTVVADGDEGLDLDAVAQLSRLASALLDDLDSQAYVLEVTSPGVDRPLSTDTHYRRAQGRLVELTFSDGSVLTGRLGELRGTTVDVVVRDGARRALSVREIPRDDIAKAVVQVEFSPPSPRELELAGQTGRHSE
jgi:ribosome maturation factor RimP